jgi:hypothetical protein
MKRIAAVCAITVCFLSCVDLLAEGVELTRAQWLKKIGASVMDESVLRETFAQVPDADRVEFVQRAMRAVSRMPVEPEKKAAVFVNAAVACIQTAKGDIRYSVIAEVFATVPVPFLPVVTEELSKRFNQEFNKLSDAAYEEIASAVLKIAAERNARTDDPAVRDTFVVLAFLRGTDNTELEAKLLALIEDERTRRLVAGWLPAALNGDYTALLAAADVDPLDLQAAEFQRQLGHSNVESILFQMRSGTTLEQSFSDSWITSQTGFDQPTDFGINRLPRFPTGYQNQEITTECKCPPPRDPWGMSGYSRTGVQNPGPFIRK